MLFFKLDYSMDMKVAGNFLFWICYRVITNELNW